MNAKRSTYKLDKLHLRLFSDETPPVDIVVLDDKVELQNRNYTVGQARQLIASLQTAVNVAECHSGDYVPF